MKLRVTYGEIKNRKIKEVSSKSERIVTTKSDGKYVAIDLPAPENMFRKHWRDNGAK